jgi:hypothetical protein
MYNIPDDTGSNLLHMNQLQRSLLQVPKSQKSQVTMFPITKFPSHKIPTLQSSQLCTKFICYNIPGDYKIPIGFKIPKLVNSHYEVHKLQNSQWLKNS